MRYLVLTLSIFSIFFSCSANNISNISEEDNDRNMEFEIQYTSPVPSEFFQPAQKQGKIELFEYGSKDYTSPTKPETHKPAYVYLPYGYSPGEKYDVIYLLHGWTGVAEEYFLGRGSNNRTPLVNIFDNLIEKGLCRPFIAVSPTWDKDNQSKGWGESTQEAAVFSQEYVNDLIPALESHYSTYLEQSDEKGILDSREHRVIGGFSLGSITTWYIFEQAFPFSKYYLPMSGDNWSQGMYGGQYYPEETAKFLADVVNGSPYRDNFYVWYAVGTNDSRLPQTHNQALAMAELTDTFNSSNFSYHMKEGGQHDFNSVWEFVYHALQDFFPLNESSNMDYYNRQSRVEDVINDPDFEGFGNLIFPVNQGYWSGDLLEDLRLTWYNYIDPDKTVEVVNYFKNNSDKIFYNIYSEQEKQADPSKRNTGLFFFKGEEGRPFAICNAGGGFAYVGAMHDSFPHALELSKKGYNAFALIYRPDSPYEDLAKAIEVIFDNAETFGVDKNNYSLWGGSAGARMAATLGNETYLRSLIGRTDIPQAKAVIMQYTGYTNASETDAPTYANCGTNDGIASWTTMQNRLSRLEQFGIPTEFHSYTGLPHGFGLGIGTVAEGWIEDAINFWERQSESNSIKSTTRSDEAKSSIYSIDGQKRNLMVRGINIVDNKKIMKK